MSHMPYDIDKYMEWFKKDLGMALDNHATHSCKCPVCEWLRYKQINFVDKE